MHQLLPSQVVLKMLHLGVRQQVQAGETNAIELQHCARPGYHPFPTNIPAAFLLSRKGLPVQLKAVCIQNARAVQPLQKSSIFLG